MTAPARLLLAIALLGPAAGAEEAVILTPEPGPAPRINGARVFGVRPGSPFLFTIAATGERPIRFAAEGLPAGLHLDPATARSFRTNVLERGGSEEAMALYVRFRGQEPSVEPLLAKRGLK